MCIVLICFPVYDVINFEINLGFLIKPFSYTKKSGQKFKNLNNEKSFLVDIESIFYHPKGFSLKRIKPTILVGESPTL